MLIELGQSEFESVRSFFYGHLQHVPVVSVLDGLHPGRVFVDRRDSPRVCLAWALELWCFVVGDCHESRLGERIKQLVHEVLIPDSDRIGSDWLEIYSVHSTNWIQLLDSILTDFGANRHQESVYRWDSSSYRRFREQYQEPEVLQTRLVKMPVTSTRVMESLSNPRQFEFRTRVAAEAVLDEQLVASCGTYSHTMECEFMVDVNTLNPSNRGRGYATAACVTLLDYAISNDLTPIWEARDDNAPSVHLAEKLGFVRTESYPVYMMRT